MNTLKWWTLLLCIAAAESAKILIAIPMSVRSHYHSTRNVGLELARRGHEVYVITTYVEEKHPETYHQIVIENKHLLDLMDGPKFNISDVLDASFMTEMSILYEGGVKHTEFTLQYPTVKKFMAEDHKFDLVISEVFYQESLNMLAHKYNAPLVLFTTFGNSYKTNYYTGNPLQLSTMVHEYASIAEIRSFWGRLKNLFFVVYDILMVKHYYLPKHEKLVKKYFRNLREPVPSLEQVTANASLILMNSHFSVDGPSAYLPNTVEVGGLHMEGLNHSLPENLQILLDGAKDGVVLMSLGSNFKSSDLPLHKRDAILKVLGKLKQKVVWKWEKEELPGKPDNVEISPWLPQKGILAHPNVKLFIAHGGLIGLQEATYYGVPILGIPLYGDQFNNLLQAKNEGYAELIEYADINEETLENLLTKMLKSDEYSEKAKEVSKRYRDRPMSGLDTAIFWIEYVIRNNGASYMKSPGLGMNFLAFYMLDIEILLYMLLFISGYGFYRLYKIVKWKLQNCSNLKKKRN